MATTGKSTVDKDKNTQWTLPILGENYLCLESNISDMPPRATTSRVCLDCGRDDLAREDEILLICPDCGGPVE